MDFGIYERFSKMNVSHTQISTINLLTILKGYLSKASIFLFFREKKKAYSVSHLSMVILTEIYYKVVLQGVLNLQQSSSVAERRSNPVSTGRQRGFLLTGMQEF